MKREPPRPGRTKLDSPLVLLPAQTVGNYLIVEAKWDRSGPYHFVIDTGSTVTLITPELAKRYPGTPPVRPLPPMPVRSAGGETTMLPQASMRRLQLNDARFENVPVLIYDCAALSAHLGIKIDGMLGFPLFRETILTLDYPRSRVLLAPAFNAPLQPGTPIAFNNTNKKPVISIQLGDASVAALVDSGSDTTLRLNPIGLNPNFAVPPRPGGVVATLTGDEEQRIGRLADSLAIGNYTLRRPLVAVTDELSAIGGGILQHFTVTFDQERSRITFYRELSEPITFRPLRSVGVSFSKTPAYWRVVGIVPNPAAENPRVQPGDLVTRINGEAVAKWDLARYEHLVATASEIRFTFLNGPNENENTLRVFDLVP
ncbi:MAG: aspartyl protease family protein [Opitutaceae bacterium]